MSGTTFHTRTEPQAKLSSCIFSFLSFLTADKKTEGSEPNDSKYYQNSISSSGNPTLFNFLWKESMQKVILH
jgi:hypothetical protein